MACRIGVSLDGQLNGFITRNLGGDVIPSLCRLPTVLALRLHKGINKPPLVLYILGGVINLFH